MPGHFRSIIAILLLVTAATWAQRIADARDTTARAKTLQLEAGSALGQGDRETWSEKSDEALHLLREAAYLYRAAGVESSDDVSLVAEYANVLELSRDFDLAADAYSQLTELEPETAEWHLKRGLALMHLGSIHRRQARESLEVAYRLAQATDVGANAAAALGELYWDASHYDIAARYAERAYSDDANNITAATIFAASLIRRGSVEPAESVLGSLRSFRGDEFARSQETIADALSDFDQSRGWFEDTLENHLSYARLLVRVGRNAEAVLALRRAGMIDPDNTAVVNLLGAILRQAGDTAGARAAFERSLELDPDQPSVRESLSALN